MYIYDSVKKTKVLFEPIKKDKVLIYVCGPTVYDDAHLGHARSSVAFDVLRRILSLKYNVTFVKNFTDIDDKIIKKMTESNCSLKEITSRYTERYRADMKAIGVEDADIEPKATETLKDIIKFIQNLIKNGAAYQTKSGVYFDTSKDEKYLSLSNRRVEESEMQARVENNEEKKNIKDFALWKTTEDESVAYDSPFGSGRPGWHIECSAMIKKHIAYEKEKFQIDIHAGGADLLFPHHENEAAQTRCESSQEIAKYWLHNGFVTINGEKMSKSLGNSFFLKDILKIYDGEIVRFYLLSSHYRANINFNETDLLQSKKRLDKIYRLKKRITDTKNIAIKDEQFEQEFIAALEDDINISKALSIVDNMINSANETLDKNQKNESVKCMTKANLELINRLLGIGNKDAYDYFQLGIDKQTKELIENLIQDRLLAKKEKNFEKADGIRDRLTKMGISLMDGIDGTKWEKNDIL